MVTQVQLDPVSARLGVYVTSMAASYSFEALNFIYAAVIC